MNFAMNRRKVLSYGAATAAVMMIPRSALAGSYNGNTDFLSNYTYGVFPELQAVGETRQSWSDRLDRFDVNNFVNNVDACGVGWCMYSAAATTGFYSFPNDTWDNLLINSGASARSPARDLFGEIADALNARGIACLCYIASDLGRADDADGQRAIDYQGPNWKQNVNDIVRAISARYGGRIAGWWIDELNDYNVGGSDRADLVASAKSGNSNAVVALNSFGSPFTNFFADEDYTAGESQGNQALGPLYPVPSGRYTDDGLQWHELGALGANGYDSRGLQYGQDDLNQYCLNLRNVGGAVTFEVYIDGLDNVGSLDIDQINQLAGVRDYLRAN